MGPQLVKRIDSAGEMETKARVISAEAANERAKGFEKYGEDIEKVALAYKKLADENAQAVFDVTSDLPFQ